MGPWIAAGLGGALGSIARHGTNVAVSRLAGEPLPYATAIVNVVGCAVIGMIAGAITSGALHLSETARVFVLVGVIGGFTTFSSLGLDTFTLLRTGHLATAVVNLAVQIVLGFGAVAAGYWLFHRSPTAGLP